ncbi:MAG: IclR family transcriptional regulator [Ottowia sp.]|uniref:IclR family transcriptional regulator n=1 Tax=unclassified Ottowia TaxID=2645081 RepID=UPI003C2C26C2
MSGVLERSFKVLEYLAEHPEGVPVSTLAAALNMPLSASHRLLGELIGFGYVRQDAHNGHYFMTIKLVSVGLAFLSRAGIVDVAQPLLDQLAAASGELVRLAVVDGDDLTFVAKAQGATHGLRYDPDMGLSVMLSCSAAGHAWLSTLTEDKALALIAKKGLGKPEDFGPKAPTSIKAAMAYVKAARQRGFSMINEVFAPGMTAMAAPVLAPGGRAIGVVTIAGPLVRLTPQRMEALGPTLLNAAHEIAQASSASALFKNRT